MESFLMIYGATGFVGEKMARQASLNGIPFILGGRNKAKLQLISNALNVPFKVFSLDDPDEIDKALQGVSVVLHCAGPYRSTYKPLVEACLRTHTHYLDLTGEIPVFEALHALDSKAKSSEIMIMPGVGFDVVPTDCLALHLKNRLPSATHLKLVFRSKGPGGLPPGTQRTAIELIPLGDWTRIDGKLLPIKSLKSKSVNFGEGSIDATQLTWGDLFTAYHSTGIPNIETYAVFAKEVNQQIKLVNLLRPLFSFKWMQKLLKGAIKPGPTLEACEMTSMHVYGEASDGEGRIVVSRLHGPEGSVIWTINCALLIVEKIRSGSAPLGFQTPAMAYGSDFILDSEGVTREVLI